MHDLPGRRGFDRVERVRAYHAGRSATSAELDEALGPGDAREEVAALAETTPPDPRAEQLVDTETPYPVCRGLFQALGLSAQQTFVDLGCGHGRVVCYGAIVTPARMVGVEIDRGRAEGARRRARALGLDRVEVRTENAIETALEGADVVYLFRPFSERVEARVLERLAEVAKSQALTVVTHRMRYARLSASAFELLSEGELTVFRSR